MKRKKSKKLERHIRSIVATGTMLLSFVIWIVIAQTPNFSGVAYALACISFICAVIHMLLEWSRVDLEEKKEAKNAKRRS